jgi:hypothetical protein
MTAAQDGRPCRPSIKHFIVTPQLPARMAAHGLSLPIPLSTLAPRTLIPLSICGRRRHRNEKSAVILRHIAMIAQTNVYATIPAQWHSPACRFAKTSCNWPGDCNRFSQC